MIGANHFYGRAAMTVFEPVINEHSIGHNQKLISSQTFSQKTAISLDLLEVNPASREDMQR